MVKIILKGVATIAFVVFVTVLVLAVMGTVQQSFLVVTNAVATVNDR